MALRSSQVLKLTILLGTVGWLTLPALGQNPSPQANAPSAVNPQEAARRKIMESDRWRRTQRDLDQWLSVQRIYTPEEVTAIKSQLNSRIARMSPSELEAHMKDTAEKLAVLTSPEAEDARVWVNQFLATARNGREQLNNKRPDVMNMSASEIRRDLQQFQQRRASTQQTHAAFDRGRAIQLQSAQDVQAARNQTREQGQELMSRAATIHPGTTRSPYAPNRDVWLPPGAAQPIIYDIGPWGTPILWHPLNTRW